MALFPCATQKQSTDPDGDQLPWRVDIEQAAEKKQWVIGLPDIIVTFADKLFDTV